MHHIEPNIRNAVRAVIIRNNRILLVKKVYEDGSQKYSLPGGAQDPGEPLTTALMRECEEEIGTEVSIDSLLHVADWFKPRNTIPPSTRHLVEFLFVCTVDDSYTPKNGSRPDKHQLEVVWVELDRLHNIPFHPRSLSAFLPSGQQNKAAIYLGEIT